MVGFNNALETARASILNWAGANLLDSVTIVRDVFGKLAFLFDNTSYPDDTQRTDLENILAQDLQGYYSGNIYWENASRNVNRYLTPLMDVMRQDRREWCIAGQGIKFYLSERPIAKKAWVSGLMDLDAVWPYEEAFHGNKPKVVTFYSFKGGMGRTTTLASVALQLARKGKNVMMVDTDIEAPGLATLFFEEDRILNGVLDYLLEHPLSGAGISNYVLDVTEPELLAEGDGSLYVLPAGKVDENYLQKLARIDYQDHREGALRGALCGMLEEIQNSYSVDYILIDARAGFHDMGGIAVAQLPHGAVLFGNDSRQSWDGITQVIHTIASCHTDNIPILIADCMCENSTAPSFVQAKEHFVQKAYTACAENYYTEGEALPGIDAVNVAHSPVFLPYDASLRQDIVLYSTQSTGGDARVRAFAERLRSEPYKAVLDRMESWFGEGDIVL
ncbi:MAG: ParA family protein [Lachnospiraceae bacterium]|nr:ParA family protein [Lachnospiraceae bacterium]